MAVAPLLSLWSLQRRVVLWQSKCIGSRPRERLLRRASNQTLRRPIPFFRSLGEYVRSPHCLSCLPLLPASQPASHPPSSPSVHDTALPALYYTHSSAVLPAIPSPLSLSPASTSACPATALRVSTHQRFVHSFIRPLPQWSAHTPASLTSRHACIRAYNHSSRWPFDAAAAVACRLAGADVWRAHRSIGTAFRRCTQRPLAALASRGRRPLACLLAQRTRATSSTAPATRHRSLLARLPSTSYLPFSSLPCLTPSTLAQRRLLRQVQLRHALPSLPLQHQPLSKCGRLTLSSCGTLSLCARAVSRRRPATYATFLRRAGKRTPSVRAQHTKHSSKASERSIDRSVAARHNSAAPEGGQAGRQAGKQAGQARSAIRSASLRTAFSVNPILRCAVDSSCVVRVRRGHIAVGRKECPPPRRSSAPQSLAATARRLVASLPRASPQLPRPRCRCVLTYPVVRLCGVVLACADVKVKKGAELTKFKLRLSRYLYTLKVTDQAKADKIAQSFPPGLKKEDIK